METTIYFKCPGCGQTALVRQAPGSCQCSSCGLDYVLLANDDDIFDAALVENMGTGPGGVLMSLALHQLVCGMPPQGSTDYVKALAARNGIALPVFRQPKNIWQTVLYFLFPSLGVKK